MSGPALELNPDVFGDRNPAVFLSYASQDAEAARRLCAGLRAAGIEVWFDQNELVGGDAWDAKIRKQIKDCALFVPVISANTQARREGYFRIEWKLAAQRTQAMADGTPFLLPLVIDDTRDGDALVPEEFRAVQWTRLRQGYGGQARDDPSVAAFCARVGKVLGVAGVADPDRAIDRAIRPGSATPAGPDARRRWLIPALAGAALIAVLAFWQPWEKPPGPAKPVAGAPASTAKSPVFPRDPDLKRAMDLVNGLDANLEDFALADEIAKAAVVQRALDAEAVIVMARVQLAFYFRGFDRSDERRAAARRYSERAVQLAPNDPEALAALGVYQYVRGADPERARELLNRAIALKPDDPFFHRHRDNAMFSDSKVPTAEALASAERTAARFSGDALVHYELARRYRDVGRIAEMESQLDRAIAITPLGNAIMWKARIALYVRGDPAEMNALLERVPARVRSTERVVFGRWAYAMVSGRPEEGLNALDSITTKWIEDFDYIGPTALLTAQLLDLQGKPELARLQYAAAFAELQAQRARAPGDANLRTLEVWINIWIMHGLGKDDEARALNRVALESISRPYNFRQLSDWWFTTIPASLLIGDREAALRNIREAVRVDDAPSSDRRPIAEGLSPATAPGVAVNARTSLRLRFKLDPRMAPWRDDREITALLAEPGARK